MAFGQEHIGHLQYVCRVQVVMILHVSSVTIVDLAQEALQLLSIEWNAVVIETQLGGDMESDHTEAVLAPHVPAHQSVIAPLAREQARKVC